MKPRMSLTHNVDNQLNRIIWKNELYIRMYQDCVGDVELDSIVHMTWHRMVETCPQVRT